MEVRTSPMELVSPSASPINQAIKTMHPPANSTTINQQSHLPQNLSTMHSNQNTAHNFSSSHTFSHNSTVPSVNQEQVQSISKNTVVTTNQANTTEQSISDKSQTNGTSGAEPSPVPYSLVSKEKEKEEKILPAVVPSQTPQISQTAQNLVVEPPAAEKSPEVSTPVNVTKSNTIDAVVAKITQPSSESKLPQDSPQRKTDVSSPTPAAVPRDKRDHATTPSPNKKPEPETVKSPIKQNAKPEPVPESPKSEEPKPQKNADHKTSPSVDSAKDSPKENPEPKTPSKTPRKRGGQNAQAGTSGTPLMLSASAKRHRIRTQHYQSPLPEVELVSKISTSTQRNTDERLIVFYKNEFLAVRNAEGGFYLCQATQNIYKTSSKIKIRWLSQTENQEKGEVYTPDFYDLIDFDCILTNLSLSRADKGKFLLPISEKTRTESILNRSLAVEKGEEIQSPSLTEEHPDGLDLSLYRDEDQLKKRKARKRHRKAPPVRATKTAATKLVPEAAKVRKVAPPAKEPPKKAAAASKKQPVAAAASKRVAAREVKAVAETTKTNKNSSKPSTSNAVKTSPVVDHKKAKVLARIGRKTATVTKATKNNSKNGKSGNKPTSTVQKTAQAVKSTSATTRGLRKSTRK